MGRLRIINAIVLRLPAKGKSCWSGCSVAQLFFYALHSEEAPAEIALHVSSIKFAS
jgi:uncharacterized membrane protein